MEDEGRQKKVEAGREKFVAYLKKKNASSQQNEQKKKKKTENDGEETNDISIGEESLDSIPLASSLEGNESIKMEISGRINGTNSTSHENNQNFQFQDGGEVSSERLQTRLKELEDILSGKEAALKAAHEELSTLKEMTSLDASTGMLETDYKTHLEEYRKRLLEFQEAVDHRDVIIGQLSNSLKQAIQTRDALQLQGDHLAQEVELLQRQLKVTTELVQGHHWDTGIKPQDYLALQNQMLVLESAVKKHESVITNLNSVIREKDAELQIKSEVLEKKCQELSQHKTKSANEIQKLMRDVEELHQKCAVAASNHNSLILEHEGQLASLQSELEENFGLQLVQIKDELRNHFNEEKQMMEHKHAEEITSYQATIAELTEISFRTDTKSDKQLDSLHTQLQESSEAIEKLVREITELKQSHMLEVESLKQQLEEGVGPKQQDEQVLETKNHYENELKTWRQQVETLNTQLQEALKAEKVFAIQLSDCKQIYETELALSKHSLMSELASYKEHVDSLNSQLQEASQAQARSTAQLHEYEAELTSCQQSHEMELASYKQRVEALNLRLQEASEAEENFPKVLAAHKQALESELSKCKEENIALNNELQKILKSEEILKKEKAELLESHNTSVLSYEQQLVSLKSSLQAAEETASFHQKELVSLKQWLQDSSNTNEVHNKEIMSYKQQVVTLNRKLEEAVNVQKKISQDLIFCKELHKEEMSSLKQKLELELNERVSDAKCRSHEAELNLCKQQIEFLNSRLQDANEAEKSHVSEITACQVQLKDYKDQVESLDRRFTEELIHAQEEFSNEISVKSQENEALLARIKELTAAEEKYKMEIMSFQQEIDNLNMQLRERAETEKKYTIEMASYQEKLTAYSNQIEVLKKFSASQDELEAYKQQVDTLKESQQYELSQLRDSHSTQMKTLEEGHAAEIASYSKQVEELTLQVGEIFKVNETLERDKSSNYSMHETEVTTYKKQVEELNIQLQESKRNEGKFALDMAECRKQLSIYQDEVASLKSNVQAEMTNLRILHSKEVNDLTLELQHLKNFKATLETEVTSLREAAKHRDEYGDSNLAQLEEITVQYLKVQSLLAGKEEIEEALERRIRDLQVELDRANTNISQMKKENNQLQETTVQYLKLEGMLAAKEEMEHMHSERIQELEQALYSVKQNSEQMQHESEQMTQKVAKAKELLRRLKLERDEVFEKCEHLESEKEQLLSEKIANSEKINDLLSQVQILKRNSNMREKSVIISNSSETSHIEDTCTGVIVPSLERASVVDSNINNDQAVISVSRFDNTQNKGCAKDSDNVSESGPLKRRKRDTVSLLEPVLSVSPSKWIERLTILEGEKIELANRLETLESQFKEQELHNKISNEENVSVKLQCEELEKKLLQFEKLKVDMDAILQHKSNLESKIIDLEHENKTFQELQEALNAELAEERMTSEDKLHELLKQELQNVIDEQNSVTVENLLLDLGQKAKEVVFLKEKLRLQVQTCQSLNDKILRLEESKAKDAKKISSCLVELADVRSELEGSWKQYQITKEELGTVKKELTILHLQKQQLESSRSRLLQMSTTRAEITPVYASSQQELHSMMEELVAEVEALKSSLESEQHRNEKLALELEMVRKGSNSVGVTDVNSNDSNGGMLELQHKLELILKSNTELVAEKESLLDKLRNQQQYIGKLQEAGGYEQVESWMSNLDKQQTDLMAELRAYREQHTSLAELVGSTGVLQETLYRQKQELLHKFEEKTVIENLLEHERTELKSAQLKIQMMENQMLEKDKISQELSRQKRLLEQDLHEIEDRLRDQEDRLQTQKLVLEKEIHERDLHIRHWQLELKAKQVGTNSEQTMKMLNQQLVQSSPESDQYDQQERLELLRSQLDNAHQQAVTRLRLHLEEQFAIHESELQKNFVAETSVLKQRHKEELLDIQQQLDDKIREIKALLSAQLHNQLDVSQDLISKLKREEITVIKQKQMADLEDMKNSLNVGQIEIYNVLKEKFEKFGEQKIALALKVLQEEHDSFHEQVVSNLIMKHNEELEVLRAKLESQRQEELLMLRQDLNKKHKDELNEVTKGLKLEISLLKQPIDSRSSRSSAQQLKQMCMEYTSSLKGKVQTWYSDCQDQLEVLNKQIDTAWQEKESNHYLAAESAGKESHTEVDIQRLLEKKEQLLIEAEVLHEEIVKRHTHAMHSLQMQLDAEHARLVEKVEQMKKTVQEGTTIASLQDQIINLVAEKEELQNKHKLAMDLLSHEHDVEVTKLRDLIANLKCGDLSDLTGLRQELEAKHAKEMEELRRYFEQKCADVEKHYSEEVFSQHSRKMSGSSCGSEKEELATDMYYGGGDHGQRLTALTHICDSYTVEPSFKDLEEHYHADFEKRCIEYRDQLDTVKLELEQKYQNEMELLKEEYESRVEELVKDLSNTHKAEIQNLETKHAKEILNMKEKLQLESTKELDSVRLECANEVGKIKMKMADVHKKELEKLKNMFEEELQRQVEELTHQMKEKEEEHVAAVKAELLNKHARDIQKLEESYADHVVDEMGKTSTDSALQKVDLENKIRTDVKQLYEEENRKLLQIIKEMEEKHAKELETKIEAERKLLTDQFDELSDILKKSAEEEQDKFVSNQKEMMSSFVKQHKQDLHSLKSQHEAALLKAQEESQKLCEDKIQELKAKHKQEVEALQQKVCKLVEERDKFDIQQSSIITSVKHTEQAEPGLELNAIRQPEDCIRDKDAMFASAISKMKKMHEHELEQVRALYEERLHDEVEQAKHDIVRALEEQIQALLANDSEDTPRPRELVELEEKFSTRYRKELNILREEHAKEVTRLKKEYETEMLSLSEKHNQSLSVLEEQMAFETKQHQEFLEQEMALLTQKVDTDFTNTDTFIDSTVQELQFLKQDIVQLEKTKLAMQIKLSEASSQGEENAISILHVDLEQLIKERDSLKKMTVTLRYLVGELVAYFTVCEDELNNTLIGELLKIEPVTVQDDGELSRNNSEINGQEYSSLPEDKSDQTNNAELKSDSSTVKNENIFSTQSSASTPRYIDVSIAQEQTTSDEVSMAYQNLERSLVPSTPRAHGTRRVHFAPDISGIISLINEDNLLEYIEKNKDLSTDFRSELDNCLERLKVEATAVLGLSNALPRTVQITREAVVLLEEKVNILTSRLEVEVKSKDELLVQLQQVQEREKEGVQLQEQIASLEVVRDVLETELRTAKARVAELEHEMGKREDVTEGFGENIQPGLVKRLQNMAQLQDKARSVLSERAVDLHKSPHLQLIEELCQEGDRLSEEARKEREDLQQQVEAADKQLRATRLFLEEQAAEREQERDDFLREITKLQELIRERDRDRSEHEQLTKEDALEGSEQQDSVRTVEALELQVKEAATLQKESGIKKEELETELKAAVDKIWVLRDIIGELENQVETKTQHVNSLEQQLQELHAILEQQSKNHQELAEELDSLRLDSGKSELTEHISHLEEQLRKHRLHVEQFQSNSTAVQQMKAQLRDLEAAVDKKTKDLESLHANTSSASCGSPSEDVSIREQLDAFRCETPEESRNTHSPVCLPLDELHRLQDKLQRHSRAEEVALKRIRDLEMQLKGVKKNEEEVVAERDVLQERMEEQLLKISALQSRLDEQRRKTDSVLKEVNTELQSKVRDQEMELNKLRETVENKNKDVKEMNANLEETRRVLALQEKEWSMKCSEELETIEKLKQTCRKLNQENIALQRNILHQEKEIKPKHSRSLERTRSLQEEMRDPKSPEQDRIFMSEIDEVHFTSNRAFEASGSGLQLDDSDLKEMLIKKDSEIMTLKSQFSEKMNRGLSELRMELKRKDQRLREYETQLADVPALETEIERLKNELKTLDTLKTEKEKLQETLDFLKASEAQLRLELEEALKKLGEKQEVIDFLHSHVAGKDEVISKMSRDQETCVGQVEELESHKRENSELKDRNAELTSELEFLKLRVSDLAAENNHLKADLDIIPGTPDELAGQVKKELDISAQLDTSLMEKLGPSEHEVVEEASFAFTAAKEGLPSTSFSHILNKILQEGINALTFSELSELHQQTCKATSAIITQDSSQVGFDVKTFPQIMPACKGGEDKQQLVRRINALENEIVRKQQEAQKKVFELETNIRHEKNCIHELRDILTQEQKRNIELQSQVGHHSRAVADLEVERDLLQKQSSYHEERLRQFIVTLEQERAKVRQLEDDLLKDKNSMKHLQSLLEAERQRARSAKLKDSDFIENMRIKLETALDNEARIRFQLEQEKRAREAAENQLSSVSQRVGVSQHAYLCSVTPAYHTSTSCEPKGKLELEQERCAKLELDLRREQRKAEELEAAVEKERQLGQQKIEIEKEIVQQLKKEFVVLESQRDTINSQLIHVREQLSLKHVEVEALERKVCMLQEAEIVRRQRRRVTDQEELDKNRRALQKAHSLQFELKQKIADLEQEVSRLKQQLLESREQEIQSQVVSAGQNRISAELKHEVEKLKHNLDENRMRELLSSRELSSSPKVASPVLEKLKTVNVMLEQHVTENAEVALTLSRLTEERQQLQARIKELEEQLKNSSESQAANGIDVPSMLATERALWAQEKAALKLALAQAEADAVHGRRTGDSADTDDRVRHLFGKYLRAESYRKALIWQKRYLLVVLGGYQESEAITVSRLAQLSGVQEAMLHQRHSTTLKKPKTRFRTAAIVVIALSRMRYMVRRWRLGRRVGSSAVLSRGYSESALSSAHSSYHGPRRRGSSTSVNSLGVPRMSSLQGYGPLSPPSRDRPMLRRWETDYVQHHVRSSESIPVSSLRSSHVAEFVDRFDHLQRRLGLGLTNPPP